MGSIVWKIESIGGAGGGGDSCIAVIVIEFVT